MARVPKYTYPATGDRTGYAHTVSNRRVPALAPTTEIDLSAAGPPRRGISTTDDAVVWSIEACFEHVETQFYALMHAVADVSFSIELSVLPNMAAPTAYNAVEGALSSVPGVDTDQASDAINRNVIESAVDEQGVRAVTDEEVLQTAIDRDALDTAVEFDDLRDSIANSIRSDDQ